MHGQTFNREEVRSSIKRLRLTITNAKHLSSAGHLHFFQHYRMHNLHIAFST